MILTDLLKLSQHGAASPIKYWLDEYNKERQGLIVQLQKVVSGLQTGSTARKNLKELVDILMLDQPDELKLAGSLLAVAEVFGEPIKDDDELIKSYAVSCNGFFKRIKLMQQMDETRKLQTKDMTKQKMREHDLKLFQEIGMMYGLEYYLAQYKYIQSLSNPKEQFAFIKQKEIDMGFGDVPGLQIDFEKLEVLEKFIYKITDFDLREHLTKEYFCARISILLATENSIQSVVKVFKRFILIIIEEFIKIGIDAVSNPVNQPYGANTKLKDIKTFL